jgi:hypothetical protein
MKWSEVMQNTMTTAVYSIENHHKYVFNLQSILSSCEALGWKTLSDLTKSLKSMTPLCLTSNSSKICMQSCLNIKTYPTEWNEMRALFIMLVTTKIQILQGVFNLLQLLVGSSYSLIINIEKKEKLSSSPHK